MENLIAKVEVYVSSLLKNKLSPDLLFHNVRHTYEVVAAVQEISRQSGFPEAQTNLLIIAAWFHDCGYTVVYRGHEDESKKIAQAFLHDHFCDAASITTVLDCIEATKFPQRPRNGMEQVICDADLYHFTKAGYPAYEKALREEFKTYLALSYTDEVWEQQNYFLLEQHQYFTKYGKEILQKFKDVNLAFLRQRLNNYL